MQLICLQCGTKTAQKNPGWCPKCGLDNAWVEDVGLDPSKPERSAPGGLVRADALDVPEVRRIKSGTAFDAVLGGGMPLGGCVLVWGRSGSGKSRLALQLFAKLHPAVYVALEETEEQSAEKLKSVGIPARNVWVTRRPDWRSVALSARPRLVLVDSISTFGGAHAVEEEARACYEWSHAHGVTVVMICHATTDGKSKGGTGPVHWSDAALIVKSRGRGQVSIDSPHKNRYGATGPGRPVGKGSIVRPVVSS